MVPKVPVLNRIVYEYLIPINAVFSWAKLPTFNPCLFTNAFSLSFYNLITIEYLCNYEIFII